MTYRVDLTDRAARSLRRIYLTIDVENSVRARAWFKGLEVTVSSLAEHPARGATIPEGGDLRQLLYGRRRHRYRIIYAIDEINRVITVLHLRHGNRESFIPDSKPDDDQA